MAACPNESNEEAMTSNHLQIKAFVLQVFSKVRISRREQYWDELPIEYKCDAGIVLAAHASNKGDQKETMEKQLQITAKSFVLHVFLAEYKLSKSFWDKLPFALKCDDDIALAALAIHSWMEGTNIIEGSDLPDELKCDRDFMIRAVAQTQRVWYSLSPSFKSDPDFARAITDYDREATRAIFDTCPHLSTDPLFWIHLINSDGCYNIFEIMQEQAPRSIRADRQVMMEALGKDLKRWHPPGPRFFSLSDRSLRRDRGFVADYIAIAVNREDNTNILHDFPLETQRLFPELLRESFSAMNRHRTWCSVNFQEAAACIAPELRKDRQVGIAWFANGGAFVEESFPKEWKKDKEIFLLIAEHCRDVCNGICHACQASFRCASPALTSDKAFMLQAVGHTASLFFNACDVLQKDFDFCVAALASSRHFHQSNSMAVRFFEEQQGYNEFVESIRARVRAKLAEHVNYMKVVLAGLMFGSGSCRLPLLQQGLETEVGYKKLIAEYVDIPIGKELQLLRKALENFPDSDEMAEILRPPMEPHDFWESPNDVTLSFRNHKRRNSRIS